ncbi:MAG TPA: ATP-binding protein [Acetobacteraceae bacterium]
MHAEDIIRLRAEVRRLMGELEQAQVALEDSQETGAALAQDRDALRRELEHRAKAVQMAEETLRELRGQLGAKAAFLFGLEAQQANQGAAEEELRMTVEELQVLAEELEEANEALRRANAELDQRVAERTAELEEANAKLQRANAELNSRVAAEVAARQQAQAVLFQQQKLEAMGQLTGGLAHDFNNLLTVMISGLNLLGRANDPARRTQLIERIREAAGRGADLTRRLLAFGRRQALQPEHIDLERRIRDLRDWLAQSLRSHLQVELRAEEGLWPIEVDYNALELALLNLAVNARDAMPEGGSITLSARNLHLTRRAAGKLGVAPGDYVEISVSDHGTGMPPEVASRAFEPFFTTKEVGQGTGLGLSQVYGFGQQSGGTAQVDTQPGRGTTVSLVLPRGSGMLATAAEAEAASPTEGAHAPAAILVVEDDDEVAALVADLLRHLGHETTRVASAAAALGALSNERPLDLVFTDVLLPGGMSGLDLAREVLRRRPGLPILLTTGYGGAMGTGDPLLGQLPLLRKPYTEEALRSCVESALAHKPGRSGAPAAAGGGLEQAAGQPAQPASFPG